MKYSTLHSSRLHRLSPGIACVLMIVAVLLPVQAQSIGTGEGEAADLDAVVVTGIRGSLQSSMNLKRDSIGVVDGIIAEDIGKFPDTNLAESLQRISGVSIDRTASGEGARVTVRGIGADFNLVLLNGRQMPTTNLVETATRSGVSSSRAFDFTNIASEAVSELEVYKTVHADMPTGGIGATLNVKTVRPLDRPGLHAQVGIKGVMDRSVDNLPKNSAGKTMTPEVSGIFSNTWMDGRFGIAINASYQERDSGYSRLDNDRGWYTFRGDDDSSLYRLPQPYEPDHVLYDIVNQPEGSDVYGRPSDPTFIINGIQRQRRNGQMVLQFAPWDNLTATVDYTWAQNKVQQKENRMWVVSSFLPGFSSWTDGPVAGPIIYSEQVDQNQPQIMSVGRPATRRELRSRGLNLEWQVSSVLDLAFDWHQSRSESVPDGPYGSYGFIGATAMIRRGFSWDFSQEFPVFNLEYGPGISRIEPEHAMLAGSLFDGGYNWQDVEQRQVRGTFRFADYQALDFGVASTEVSNHATATRALRTTWNGVGTPEDYADDIFQIDHLSRYFKQFRGHNDPRFSDRFLLIDFERLRQRAIEVGEDENMLRESSVFVRELRATEKTSSAYVQWRNTFDWIIPVNAAIGMRYEKTKVISPSAVLPPAGNVSWSTYLPEFVFELGEVPILDSASGEYDYWLPSLDVRADLRENLLLRASYGKSIGRASWSDIQGGVVVGNFLRAQEGTGTQGDPGLLPLESKNFDLSLEWYYGQGSYLSMGYFRKKISNFISNSIVRAAPYDLHTPVNGAYWNNAINLGGCLDADFVCIRQYILTHHAGEPGVEYTGVDGSNLPTGTITGLDTDPIAEFNIVVPVNKRSDTLDGWELNLQHMFGNSGFGFSLNYTKVDSGLSFDNTRLGDQYPMVGLSDTANLVLFYDKNPWQVRVAYNWRDEFLSSANDDLGPNPRYTESYGQLDANITWAMNEKLSMFVEGINLTNETQRIHGRHYNMLASLTQTGPRYMFGVRYKF